MRYASLFAVTVLGVILAASLFSPVAAISGIEIAKVTTNGDSTTFFYFTFVGGGLDLLFGLYGGGPAQDIFASDLQPGVAYTVHETVDAGWALTNVLCEGTVSVPTPSTFTYISGGVIITFAEGDFVTCTFTNSPISPVVGGVVMPANNFAIVAPWLAIIGLVGCIGTAVVVRKKRHP
jgi:hypothetical protein